MKSDMDKAKKFLKNRKVTYKQIALKTEISESTIRKYGMKKSSLQDGKWENINKLARLYDDSVIANNLGSLNDWNYLKKWVNENILDDRIGKTIKKIILKDKKVIVEIISNLTNEA